MTSSHGWWPFLNLPRSMIGKQDALHRPLKYLLKEKKSFGAILEPTYHISENLLFWKTQAELKFWEQRN